MKMSVISKLRVSVEAGVRGRGEEYYRGGHVHLDRIRKSFFEATVIGTRPYSVKVRRATSALGGSCSCPYFDSEMDACQHGWATLLAAGARGLLGADVENPRARL